MKKKLFVLLMFVAIVACAGVYAQQTNEEDVSEVVGDGSGTSCTVTSNCFGFLGLGVEGSVSCTGSTCERGYEYVICDGKKTECWNDEAEFSCNVVFLVGALFL